MSTPDVVQTLIPQAGAPTGGATFAERGDPGAPGACLWCGAKLRGVGPAIRKVHPDLVEARGDYGDNAFCGMRCGFSFGRRLAVLGSRLRVKP